MGWGLDRKESHYKLQYSNSIDVQNSLKNISNQDENDALSSPLFLCRSNSAHKFKASMQILPQLNYLLFRDMQATVK